MEVKLAAAVGDGDVRHLVWLADRIGADLLDAMVVTTGRYAYRRPDGIAVVPLALLGARPKPPWRRHRRQAVPAKTTPAFLAVGDDRRAPAKFAKSSPSDSLPDTSRSCSGNPVLSCCPRTTQCR